MNINPTEVKSDFKFEISEYDQTLTIIKDGVTIKLSYWECLLLNRILDKQINC